MSEVCRFNFPSSQSWLTTSQHYPHLISDSEQLRMGRRLAFPSSLKDQRHPVKIWTDLLNDHPGFRLLLPYTVITPASTAVSLSPRQRHHPDTTTLVCVYVNSQRPAQVQVRRSPSTQRGSKHGFHT